MNKKIYKAITIVFITTAVIILSASPAFTLGITDFTASLSATNKHIIAGESVNFLVHVVNIGDYNLDYINISTMRGGVIKSYEDVIEEGESVDIPFSLVIDTTGEIAYQFRVSGGNADGSKTVVTNTVTITVTAPQTPTPQPTPPSATPPPSSPTPFPSPSPTPTATPEPALVPTPSTTPEPVQIQPIDEDAAEEQLEPDSAGSSNTAFYIIIGVLGALVIAGAAAVTLLLRSRRKTNKQNSE